MKTGISKDKWQEIMCMFVWGEEKNEYESEEEEDNNSAFDSRSFSWASRCFYSYYQQGTEYMQSTVLSW